MTAGGRDWPDREAWARSRRTAYADDIDKAVDAVSADPADYATPAEIARASAELGNYWRQLGRDLRAANAAATAVWPLHNTRVRRSSTALALAEARDALHPEAKELVEHAEALRHHRQLVNTAITELTGGESATRLCTWTANQAERWMPANACPTWREIVARWQAARDQAAADYTEQTRNRPVDDEAWQRELRRRADIDRVSADRSAGRIGRAPHLAAERAGWTPAQVEVVRRLDERAARLLAEARRRTGS